MTSIGPRFAAIDRPSPEWDELCADALIEIASDAKRGAEHRDWVVVLGEIERNLNFIRETLQENGIALPSR